MSSDPQRGAFTLDDLDPAAGGVDPFDQLDSEFRATYGRSLRFTGRDTQTHIRLHGPGQARDIGVRELSGDELKFILKRGPEIGLNLRDYSKAQPHTTSTGVRITGPHVHADLSKPANNISGKGQFTAADIEDQATGAFTVRDLGSESVSSPIQQPQSPDSPAILPSPEPSQGVAQASPGRLRTPSLPTDDLRSVRGLGDDTATGGSGIIAPNARLYSRENVQKQAADAINRMVGDEPAFQAWYKERAAKLGLDPDPDAPEHHYDYRAAFEAGAEPNAQGHWPSQFKALDHPNRFVDGIDTITGQPVKRAQDVARVPLSESSKTIAKSIPLPKPPPARSGHLLGALPGETLEDIQKQRDETKNAKAGASFSSSFTAFRQEDATVPDRTVNVSAGSDANLEGDVYREWYNAMKAGDYRQASLAARIYDERFPRGGTYRRHIYDPITGVDSVPFSEKQDAREGAVAVYAGDLPKTGLKGEALRQEVERRFAAGLGFNDTDREVFKEKYGFDPARTTGETTAKTQIKQSPEDFEKRWLEHATEGDKTGLIRVPRVTAEKIQEFFNDKRLSDPSLAQAEATMPEEAGALQKGTQQFAAGVTQGMVGTLGSTAKGAGILLREASQWLSKNSKTPISDMLISGGDWLNKFAQEASFEQTPGTEKELLTPFGLGQGLGSGATFALTGGAGKVGAGIAGALSQAGSSYDETYKRLIDRGMNAKDAHRAAMNAAILNIPVGMTEAFGVGGTLDRAIEHGVAGAGFGKNLLASFVLGANEEGTQERLQQRLGNAIAQVSGDPKRPLSEGEAQATIVALLTGGIMEGGMTAATHEGSPKGTGKPHVNLLEAEPGRPSGRPGIKPQMGAPIETTGAKPTAKEAAVTKGETHAEAIRGDQGIVSGKRQTLEAKTAKPETEVISAAERQRLKEKSMRGESFTPAEQDTVDRIQQEFEARRNLPAEEAAKLPEKEWQDWVGSRVPSEIVGNSDVATADEAHRATVLRGDTEGARMIRKRISFLATEEEDGTPLPRNVESNKRTEQVIAQMKSREKAVETQKKKEPPSGPISTKESTVGPVATQTVESIAKRSGPVSEQAAPELSKAEAYKQTLRDQKTEQDKQLRDLGYNPDEVTGKQARKILADEKAKFAEAEVEAETMAVAAKKKFSEEGKGVFTETGRYGVKPADRAEVERFRAASQEAETMARSARGEGKIVSEEPARVPGVAGVVKRAREGERRAQVEGAIDQQTKLQNKGQWLKAQPHAEADPNREIAVIDLNNLKQANDEFGHAIGDRYIEHAATVVREEAKKAGIPERDLFRTGGDEIHIIGNKGTLAPVIKAIKARVAEFKHEDFTGGAAAGIAPTTKRADALAYADKRAMKRYEMKPEHRAEVTKFKAASAEAEKMAVAARAELRNVETQTAQSRSQTYQAQARGEAQQEAGEVAPQVQKQGEAVALIRTLPQPLHGNATVPEGLHDRLLTNIEVLSDLMERPAFRDHGLGGFDVPTQRMVMARVLTALHDSKIRDAVIKNTSKAVVDHLIGLKSASQVSLHDQSVLKDQLAIDPDGAISARSDVADAAILEIARSATEDLSARQEPGRIAGDRSAASGAGAGFGRRTGATHTTKNTLTNLARLPQELSSANKAGTVDFRHGAAPPRSSTVSGVPGSESGTPIISKPESAANAFAAALAARLAEKRQSKAEQLKQAIRESKGAPKKLFQQESPASFESIPLPDDIKRPLLEIAQSFLAEGTKDYAQLVRNFETLLGGDFEYLIDHLPAVVQHAENLERLRTAPSDKIDLAPGEATEKAVATGKTSRAVTPRGIEVKTRFALFESEQPITSHDIELRPNPHFPEGVQNRDRAKVSSEDDLNEKIKRFEPEYLGRSIEAGRGAPIIGPDMAVESGNGRVIMLRRIYRNYPVQAAKYREWLKENATRFGMTAARVATMDHPILAQIRLTQLSPAERIQFAEQANEDTQLKLSPVEVARGDARKLGTGLIAQFKPGTDGDILAASNREFVKGFLDQVVGPSRGDLLTSSGELNHTGVDRVRNAIFARAYADTDAGIQALEKLAEETDVNTKRVITAMVSVAPRFVELKQMITGGGRYNLDLSPDLAEAARQLSLVRESGVTVDEFLRQGQLFGENLSRVQKKLLWTLNEHSRSATKLGQVLTNYLDAVDAIGDPRQKSFFSENVPTKEEILEAAVRRLSDADQSNVRPDTKETIGGAREGLFAERPAPATGTETTPAGNREGTVAPKKEATQSTKPIVPTDRSSFKKALISEWKYPEDVAHHTASVAEALASSYAHDLKSTDPKTDTAKAKRAFYESVRIAPAGEQGLPTLNQPAYHGSPFHFDKFTLDHMGKGEGAQAYGWGLYFAADEAVARFYKEKFEERLSDRQRKERNRIFYAGDETLTAIKDLLSRYPILTGRQSLDESAQKMQDLLIDGNHSFYVNLDYNQKGKIREFKAAFDPFYTKITELAKRAEATARTGEAYQAWSKEQQGATLYKVELKPTEDEYLLWDKPLSQQSERVKQALKQFPDLSDTTSGEDVYKELRRRAAIKITGSEGAALAAHPDSLSGSSQEQASKQLRDAGIRGIKYLDQFSRAQGEGSHNYVIFDDADITIEQILRQDALASTEFTLTGEAIIRVGQNPNASSAIHEIKHAVNPLLFRLASQPNAPASLKEAVRVIETESMGLNEGEFLPLHGQWVNGTINVADRARYVKAQESDARKWEGYFREGVAPTSALKAAFAKFKEWLSAIYQRLRPDMELTDSVRLAFDRILGGEREQAAAKIIPEDHWNFRRSSFASPETEAHFRDIVRNAAVESGGEHKVRVSREQHLERVAELSSDLIPEVKRVRESMIASREIFTAAAQYAQTLTNQAQQLRTQLTPATMPDEALALEDKIAALEHDASEIMAHTIGVRSEFGRNLALLATQKTDQLAPEKVLAIGKKLAEQRGLEQTSSTWKTAARKLFGLSNEIQSAQTEKTRIAKERKGVQEAATKKTTKREPWQSVMLSNLKSQAKEASARLQQMYGHKLYQAGSLTTEELDQVRAKFESLKKTAAGRPIKTVVDDYIRQLGLFGSEMSPAQQGALMELASPTRRGALRAEQSLLFETSPTIESRREQSELDKAGPSNLLFQRSEQTDTPGFKKWFGDSKVVDEKGEPLVVYHGTNADFEEFKKSSDGGIYFAQTPSQAVMRGSGEGKNLVPVYLAIENPRRSRDTGGEWRKQILSAKAAGNDGIVYLNRWEGVSLDTVLRAQREGVNLDKLTDTQFRRYVPEARDSYIAFEPTQIKSAIGNRGTFDPNNPNILFQREPDLPALAHDIATILAARVAEESQTKNGLPLERILEGMRGAFPDVIGQYEEQIKATADALLKDARRQALVAATRDPETQVSARRQLALDVADSKRLERQTQQAADQRRKQIDRIWEREAEKAAKEAAVAWDKSNAEWQKIQEETVAQGMLAEVQRERAFKQKEQRRIAEQQIAAEKLGTEESQKRLAEIDAAQARERQQIDADLKAEIAAQKQFEKDQRTAVLEEAKRITRAALEAEHARLQDRADEARAQMKADREAAREAQKDMGADARMRRKAEREQAALQRRWDYPIIQAATAARERISRPGYSPTIEDIASIAAAMRLEEGRTASPYRELVARFGDFYRQNAVAIRQRAAAMLTEARSGAAQRRLETKAAGRAEGKTKPSEQAQAREDYAQWQAEELSKLAAEEAWQDKRIRNAKRDLAKEFAKLNKLPWWEHAVDWWGLTRELITSVDLPHLRQGIPTLLNHPRVWAESLFKSASTWTEAQMDQKVNAMEAHPLAELARLSGLELWGISERRNPLSNLARSEQYQNRIAEKFPHVRISKRQFTVAMDWMRLNVFALHAAPFLEKFPPSLHPEIYSETARVINILNGVGDLGNFNKYAQFLSRFLFFALRYMTSRFQLLGMLRAPLGDWAYRNQPWEVRRIAAKESYLYVTKMAAMFALAHVLGITSFDMDDDEFLKLHIPGTNQYWDLTGGIGGYIKTLLKLTRSALRTVGGQRSFAGDSAGDTIQQFVRSKLAPVPGAIWDWKSGRTYIGEPFTWTDEAIKNTVPMVLKDQYENIKTDGAKGLIALPFGLLGGSVSTFRSRKMPDRTGSEAERYATGFLREKMGAIPETPQEAERRQLLTELAAAQKAGRPTERIIAELERGTPMQRLVPSLAGKPSGPLTEKEKENLAKRMTETPLERAYPHLSEQEKQEVLKVATPTERALIEPTSEKMSERLKVLFQSDEYKAAPTTDRAEMLKRVAGTVRKNKGDAETELGIERDVIHDRVVEAVKSRPEFKSLDKSQQEAVMRKVGQAFRMFSIPEKVPTGIREERAQKVREMLRALEERGVFDRTVDRLLHVAMKKTA